MDGAEGCRVDPSPAAKKELEQKSIKEKKHKKRNERQGAKQRGEFGCFGHESQLLAGTVCAIFHS